MEATDTELVVVGAGAGGLYTALCAARAGAPVTLVSATPLAGSSSYWAQGGRAAAGAATPLAGSSSYWAQGGLAAAVAAEDSPELHLRDTLKAGRGAVRESAARVLCQEAPRAVEDLAGLGVSFDADRHGNLALGLEGGHSARRVVHAGGAATGRRLIRQLSALVAEHPGIDVLEGRRVQGLISAGGRCHGVLLDGDGDAIAAPATVLATGGAAALWARTTNPPGATGGGLLLAFAAGATLADLELVQFHPTAVAAPPHDPTAPNGQVGRRARGRLEDADGFLVTEAVRGEGARLLDERGERFVDELAPRDEVARAIERQMKATGAPAVYLDMRDVDPALFPNVVSALNRSGIDPERQLVPVSPAAHYMMGGIATDLNGRSTLAGLYAVGECSDTGLHGANRLASNSLTECFVFGARAARSALEEPAADPAALREAARAPVPAVPVPSPESRRALWELAGIEREGPGLERLAGDRHPLVRLIAACALTRQESRGAHQRRDFPDLDRTLDEHHVTVRGDAAPALERWS